MITFKPTILKEALGTRLMIRPETLCEKIAIKMRGYRRVNGWVGSQLYCHEKHSTIVSIAEKEVCKS